MFGGNNAPDNTSERVRERERERKGERERRKVGELLSFSRNVASSVRT